MTGGYRSYLTLAGAAAAGQGFLFLVSPIVTRLYTPADFGGFGMMLGVASLIASVGTGRLEHAIPVTNNLAGAIRVFVLGFVLILGSAALAAAAVWGLGYCEVLSGTWAGLPLALIPAAAVAVASFQLANALLLREQAYQSVGANRVLQGGVTGILQLGFGWLSGGTVGLVLAQTLGYLAGCTSGSRRAVLRTMMLTRRRGIKLRATFQRYRRYPLVMTPAALFNQASQQLPVFAIGYIYGLHEAGLYALVMRVCGGPLGLIGQAIGQVYAAEFRSLLREDGGALLAKRYLALLTRLLAIGSLAVLVLVLGLKIGDQLLFGANWAKVGDVAMYLSMMLLLDFATTPIATTLGYLERQRLQLYWDLFRLCAVSLVFAGAFANSISYEAALMMHSAVWGVTLMGHAWLTYRACRHLPSVGLQR